MDKIRVFPLKLNNEWGMEVLAYDLQLIDESATIADYLNSLNGFASQYMADCKGCDGCCHERAPLIAADIDALANILPSKGNYPCHEVVKVFGSLKISSQGWADITLSRPNGNCIFLDEKGKFCKQHLARPFVCRSHFCIPQTPRAMELRSQIVNTGEDELIRRLLLEETKGAPAVMEKLDRNDYPVSLISTQNSYEDIILKTICNDNLWQQLLA